MERIETQVTSPTTPAVSLAVREYGDRSADTHLLLVHGFPDDQTMWEPVLKRLPSEWHLITYDVRGCGDSSRPEGVPAYRTPLLVEDLIAVLDACVPPQEQVHLVAHDWGSTGAWEAIAAETWDPRLEGRIATYTSASGPSLDHLGTLASTWRGRLRLLPQLLHSWYVWLFLVPRLPEIAWNANRRLRPLLRRLDPTIDLLPWGLQVASNSRHSVNLYRANVVRQLRAPLAWRTSVPVQLIVATRDPWVLPVSVAGLEARCRDLTRVEIEAGHWLPRSRPEEFAELVVAFVTTRGQRRRA